MSDNRIRLRSIQRRRRLRAARRREPQTPRRLASEVEAAGLDAVEDVPLAVHRWRGTLSRDCSAQDAGMILLLRGDYARNSDG